MATSILFKPELGLPLNPGGESPIQNAAMGEDGHLWKIYRVAADGVIPTGLVTLADGTGFYSDNPSDNTDGSIDVSNCSGVSFAINAHLVALTFVDIILKFCDRAGQFDFWQTIFDGALVGSDYIYTPRLSFYRILAANTDEDLIFSVPVPNAKFMRIFIQGSGVNTNSNIVIKFARGWLDNLGVFTV